MRSLGNMPRIVIISEVLGLLLLVVAYLSINNYLSLPGEMGTPTAAIMMILWGRPDDPGGSVYRLAGSQRFWSIIGQC